MTTTKPSSRAPSPSYVTLPKMSHQPPTVLAFLCQRFPRIGQDIWEERLVEGKVTSDAGLPIASQTPYQMGLRLLYYREVAEEPEIPGQEEILFQNERILVADKPHFLPVTPGGPYVNECLLYRLRRRTGLQGLTPIHRLDRDTAGLVLFATRRQGASPYGELFQRAKVEKEYLAMGKFTERDRPPVGSTWRVENRLVQGEPFFRLRVAPAEQGPANASTELELLRDLGEVGLFRLRPQTGKTHQLRLHMAGLGFPILGDRFYPDLFPKATPDFANPLRLLARGLRFKDPHDGADRRFESRQSLLGSGDGI
jgi:tRNA pseudouridine32 synthase/23S rRNA pseudouridine746 synthase